MGAYLNVDRWFYKQPNGFLRMKRTSSEAAKQFPVRYRLIYRNSKASGLCRALMTERGLPLSEAWEEVKRMFNTYGEKDAPKRQHSETEKHL